MSFVGAGFLGFAHTIPQVNRWTHGTLVTAMHGHMAFWGAYAMIVLAMISYALPSLTGGRREQGSTLGYWAFWLQISGMFGMTLSFATAGIAQVYLERIMGMGYLDAQLKIQIHFVMLIATASLFTVGVALFIYDFFRHAPRLVVDEPAPAPAPAAPQASAAAADVTGFSSSAWSAPEFDLASAAELCVDLGRLVNGRDLPGLMARAATVLEAKGLVLWVSDATGLSLRPSVAHGYSEKVLQRIGSLPTDGDNVTSLAYRTLQPQVVRGSIDGHGALAVPLITGQGCVGVLAAEVQGAKPGDARFAVARIIAAQLSTLVSPAAAASPLAARPAVVLPTSFT